MDMLKWAEHEIELAFKDEDSECGFNYGKSCAESALKAFKSLLEDGHSGMSIGITKSILNRLIDHKTLTPITDDDFDDSLNEIHEPKKYLKDRGLKYSIQCPRMSSVFKEETLDGKVSYHDIDRVVCCDIDNNSTFHYGKVSNMIDEMFPITMPYNPASEPFVVYCNQCLVDPKIGDWDTDAIFYVKTPEGAQININKFYKYVDSDDNEIEITEEEFNERKAKSTKRY